MRQPLEINVVDDKGLEKGWRSLNFDGIVADGQGSEVGVFGFNILMIYCHGPTRRRESPTMFEDTESFEECLLPPSCPPFPLGLECESFPIELCWER